MVFIKKYWKLEYILWITLLIISAISLLSNIGTYVRGGDIKRDPKWMELVIVPLYFTQQSNFVAFILSFLICFKLINNKNLIKTLSIFMFVNLTITLVIYWAVLFPKMNSHDWLSWFRNSTLHGLTPILAVVIFIIRYVVNKVGEEEEKINIWKKSAIHLIYPILYLIFAIIFYFIIGGDKKDAIYSFLDIKTNPITFAIYVPSIALFYYLLTALSSFLTNPKKQKNKVML